MAAQRAGEGRAPTAEAAPGERPGYDPTPRERPGLDAAPDMADKLGDERRQWPHASVGAPSRHRTERHGLSIQRTIEAKSDHVRRHFTDTATRQAWLRRVADGSHSEGFRRVADEDWDLAEREGVLTCPIESCGGPDGSTLAVRITQKDDGRTQVALQHEGLASEAERVVMRAGWSEALDALAVHFQEADE